MEIEINPETYNDLLPKLYNTTKRIVINYGGAGSGKSVSTVQCFILFGLTRSTKLMCVRKVGSSLTDSLIAEFRVQLDNWGVDYKILGFGSACRIKLKLTGTVILFKGLDNVEKLKSISGIEKILVEEATGDKFGRGEVTEDDFNQLNTRIRGKNLIHPQLFLCLNPTSVDSWIYKRFFATSIMQPLIDTFHTTYLDNRFLDENYASVLQNYANTDYNHYQVYCLGNWGSVRSGNEMYRGFTHANISSTIKYNPELPLHITFDENVNPYLSCVISQVDDKNVNIIDEITIPNLNLQQVCKEVTNRYPTHDKGMYIYGDATSQKKNTTLGKNENFFTLAANNLSRYHPQLRLSSSNPSVVVRTDWINSIFGGNTSINLLISTKCNALIQDYERVQTDSDGTKHKQVIRKDGISYEQFGHTSDAVEYLMCKCFHNEYEAYIRNGKQKVYRVGSSNQYGY